MIKRDFFSSLFFVGLSIFICQQSIFIGIGTLENPGSGMLSFGASIVIGVLSFWLCIKSFRSKKSSENISDPAPIRWGKFFTLCICLFSYALVVEYVGFVGTTFFFVLSLFYLNKVNNYWLVIVGAVFIAIGNYVLFGILLGLSLPQGFFGW